MKKEVYDSLTEKEKIWAMLWMETNQLLRQLNRAIDIEVRDESDVNAPR